MNKSEISERAAREISAKIKKHTGQYYAHEFFMEAVERAIAESQGENKNPTTAERLAEVTSRMEVATTDGDTSQLTPDDIGDIYAWLLWAQGKSSEER